jgi:hypothetical protein
MTGQFIPWSAEEVQAFCARLDAAAPQDRSHLSNAYRVTSHRFPMRIAGITPLSSSA